MNNKLKAAIFTITSVTFGSFLDGLSKLLSTRLSFQEVTAGRFFFAFLTMLPLLFFKQTRNDFKTKHISLHCLRGALFCLGLCLWVLGLKMTMIATTTLIGFTSYLFTIILAYFFLKEKVSIRTWICSIISFLSLFFVVNVHELSWSSGATILLFSAFLFAVSDIINKKYSQQETSIAMAFYSNFFACLFSVILGLSQFIMPTLQEIGLFILLGLGSNFLLVTILKAYELVDAAFTTPFKFFEFISGLIVGFLFFKEIPGYNNYIALAIILACNAYLFIAEKNNK